MIICDWKINFVLLIKNLLRKYNEIENKFSNRRFNKIYTFKNYNCAIVNNYEDIQKFKDKNKNLIDKCNSLDDESLNGHTEGKLSGWCACCNKNVDFYWKLMPQYSDHILFTETFSCQLCGINNRIRAIIHLFKIFEKSEPKNKKIYCYEYFTPFFKYLYNNYSADNEVIGSEYFGADRKSGEIVDGVLHEDSLNLSFNDNEFDYIFSNDVFEHVSDIDKTLSEVKRCLKKGGKLVLRIPVTWSRENTIKLAEIENGEVKFLAPPIYHGGFSFDDPNGCLVFYDYGQDIFEIMKKAGFKKTYGIAIEDEKFGNIGVEPVVVFICEK